MVAKSKSKVWIYALLILVATVTLFIVFYPKPNREYFSALSACEGTNKANTLVFFHMDGCGHCQKFKPVWKEFSSQLDSQTWGKKVCLAEISADDQNSSDILAKYDVRAFPTILLFKNGTGGFEGNPTDFNGPRTVEGLNSFLAKNTH